jgi:hypothetical protein
MTWLFFLWTALMLGSATLVAGALARGMKGHLHIRRWLIGFCFCSVLATLASLVMSVSTAIGLVRL